MDLLLPIEVDASRPWTRFLNKTTTTTDRDLASGSSDAVFELGVTELGVIVQIFLLLGGDDQRKLFLREGLLKSYMTYGTKMNCKNNFRIRIFSESVDTRKTKTIIYLKIVPLYIFNILTHH